MVLCGNLVRDNMRVIEKEWLESLPRRWFSQIGKWWPISTLVIDTFKNHKLLLALKHSSPFMSLKASINLVQNWLDHQL